MINGSVAVVKIFISTYMCASYGKKIRVRCSNMEGFQEQLSPDLTPARRQLN